MSVEFSGWDSVVGTDPSVNGLPRAKDTDTTDAQSEDTVQETPAQQRLRLIQLLLGWGFLGIIMVGVIALLFMRTSIARSVTALVATLSASAALVLNHITLRAYIDSLLAKAAEEQAADESEIFRDLDITNFVSVESRWGFWAVVVYLGAFAIANGLMVAYRLWGGGMLFNLSVQRREAPSQ